MKEKMETTIMGYIWSTIRIIPSFLAKHGQVPLMEETALQCIIH